jgi:Tol biopolymer transport system component
VFASERSGIPEIWVSDADGANQVQLTSFEAGGSGSPRWSPDSRQIAFDRFTESGFAIYVMGAEGGPPRRLTTEASNDSAPRWSSDGRWIYFASDRAGSFQVWKIPAGGGQAVQVTKQGGFAAIESRDGRFVYYAKGRDEVPGIWKVPSEGGDETPVLDLPEAGYWGYWALADDGIYYVNTAAKPRPRVEFFSFATRKVKRIAEVEKELQQHNAGFAVSPDGRWFLYTPVDHKSSDIMLVENFE